MKSLGDSWTNGGEWIAKSKYDASASLDQDDLEELGMFTQVLLCESLMW